ncbi:hypothetical protein JQC67_00040 [Aurantibacter crassamenti]|uniref:DUF6090 family protein n=1 Tax=Aurantibacter crassamenti TaxID=1837375 RepID=UPI00193AA826|nr:DUF6090 family protein [Aurantibacter crassamenti]MBM1104513.1 hypothetical protein [Aurantibacter crassamenti]
MIKFFRSIRQQLLSENKFSKYLLYAIGEIILVVIGILIALSINNWNEGRKLENDRLKLMRDLKKELLINKASLDNHLLGLQINNSQLNKVINFSAGTLELPIDSLRIYSSNLIYPIDLSILNSVQEEAISAGKFEILSDNLKHQLSILKDYSESRVKIDEKLKESILNKDTEVINLILNLSAFPDIPERFYVQQPTSMHPDFIKSDDELVSLIKSSKTYSTIFQIYYLSITDQIWIKYGLLNHTNETIELIEKELNEK